MSNGLLLWADDEIELLKAHIIFLEKKGYEIISVSNGADAIEQCKSQTFDLILLDEMMPGLTGLDTLQQIKEISPSTPVVMVTKSEEEDIMNQAVGAKIADYLIKPVNPNQILLTLKKNIHKKEIVTQVTQTEYQQNFADISMQIDECKTFEDWQNIYKKLVHWELELSSTDSNMTEMLEMQKQEANNRFAKYIANNYEEWIVSLSSNKNNVKDRPLLSPEIFKNNVFPLLDKDEKVFLIVVDNLRFDQWRIISNEINNLFNVEENTYLTILPTATQYARNAIFSGLMPLQIKQMYPNLWVDEDEDEGKNLNESELIKSQLERYRRKKSFSYHKINDSEAANNLLQQFNLLEKNDLNIVVLNFIDMLSHARTESRMVRELANNESAYRSITASWFKHSSIFNLFEKLSQSNFNILLTTDHGSIRTQKPIKIVGDRNTNTNLRYKIGKNLNYNNKEVFVINNPEKAMLPLLNVSSKYVFAYGTGFFAYPNNYSHYVSYYKNTFQHGGISMEEMIVPLINLTPRKR